MSDLANAPERSFVYRSEMNRYLRDRKHGLAYSNANLWSSKFDLGQSLRMNLRMYVPRACRE